MVHRDLEKLNWNDLKIFLEVADASSMRAAARKMGISHSKISRRIDNLEENLGVSLFERSPDGYLLTDAGRELLPIALNTNEALHVFGLNVAGRDASLVGQICVTIPDNNTSDLLLPYFLEFMDLHPAIQIKINDSDKLFDLSRREADLAIRFGNNPPDHLIGRKLGNLGQAAYATQEYVDTHKPERPDSTAKWVGWGLPDNKPAWIDKSPFPHLGIMGHFNSLRIQYETTRQGRGIGFFPCFLGDSDPTLKRLSPTKQTLDVWMLWHRDMRSAARLRIFREFLSSKIPEIRSKLEGTFNYRGDP